jgi:hypothetical protein
MISTRRLYNGVIPVSSSPHEKLRPDGQPLRQPVEHGKGGVRQTARHRCRPPARLPRRLRQRHRRQRRAHLRRPQPRRDAQGRITAGLAAFREDCASSIWPAPIENRKSKIENPPHLRPARPRRHPRRLVLGVRDYAHKSGFKRALLASPAASILPSSPCSPPKHLARKNVIGVSLPSVDFLAALQGRRPHSRRQPRHRFETIAIAEAVAAGEQPSAPSLPDASPRRHRGEHPGPRPRRPHDGALEQVRLAPPHHRATRAKSPSATARSTATCAAASRSSATSSRPRSTPSPAGSTGTARIIPLNTHREAPERRTAPRPDRPGQPPALRRARRDPQGLRRGRPVPRDLVARGFARRSSTTSSARSTSTNTSASRPPPA